MSIAACLVVYGLAVIILGPLLLRRLTRGGYAPHLAVAAWLTAIGSVLLAWISAVVLMIIDVAWHPGWHGLTASCPAWLRNAVHGHVGISPHIALFTVVATVLAAVTVATARLARTMVQLRASSYDHAHAVRLVGRRAGERDVVVIDAARPAAYCVAGRPSAIVVTTAALAALDDRQLAAVLDHERAHLAGHHFHVVSALRGLAAAFPRLSLMTDGARHVASLLEMCADDASVRRHGSGPLLGGLMKLCGAAPAHALGAADVAILGRAERLIAVHTLLARARTRALLICTVAILAAGPLITAGLAASSMC